MKVLFLDVPNVSIFWKRTVNDLNAGGIAVTGGLEHQGDTVDHYDLNARLNRYRTDVDNFELTDTELKVLTDVDVLKAYLEDNKFGETLKRVTHMLLKDINFEKYDWIGMSVNRRGQQIWSMKITLNFAILLTALIKKQFKKAVYIGGATVLDKVGDKYLEDIFNKIPKAYQPDHYIMGQGTHGLSKFTKNPQVKANSKYEFHFKNTNVVKVQSKYKFTHMNYPKIEFENIDQVLSVPSEFIPKKVLFRYPKLRDVEPFQLYPYKFTDGCRFKCSFCSMATINGFTALSAVDTVDHLEEMVQRGAKHFRFFNDNINFKKSWLIEFCNEIIKRKLDITWNDSANLRYGDKELFTLMRKAGCIKLWYGTETIDDELLKLIKKQVTGSKIKQNLKIAHQVGIFNCCNFIFNFPHETDEQFDRLKNFQSEGIKEKYINTYQNNIFCVQSGSEYLLNPAKFKVEIMENDELVWDQIKYNEVGGRKWEQIVSDGLKKSDTLAENGFLASVKEIRANDFIITALHKAKYSFAEIIEFYDVVEEMLSREEMIQWAEGIGMTTYQLPRNIKNRIKKIENWDKKYPTSASVIQPNASFEK